MLRGGGAPRPQTREGCPSPRLTPERAWLSCVSTEREDTARRCELNPSTIPLDVHQSVMLCALNSHEDLCHSVPNKTGEQTRHLKGRVGSPGEGRHHLGTRNVRPPGRPCWPCPRGLEGRQPAPPPAGPQAPCITAPGPLLGGAQRGAASHQLCLVRLSLTLLKKK